MKSKSEARSLLQHFCLYVETQYPLKVKCIRSDQGREFNMFEFYSLKGIHHQTSCVSTPQQIVCGKKTTTHIECIQSLKISSSSAISFWSDGILHAVHLINKVPSPIIQHKTPYELYIVLLLLSITYMCSGALLLPLLCLQIEQSSIQEHTNASFWAISRHQGLQIILLELSFHICF